MFVSVIIPNFNYARYLRSAVDSALAQSFRDLEVIVVDDGSTDDSLDKLSGYEARITMISQTNQGVAAARNRGVAASKGDLLAFLDADDEWAVTKIERQVEKFCAGTFGLVHTAVAEIDADGVITGHQTDGMEGSVADEMLLFRQPVILGGGSGSLLSREAFNEVGGFDTRLSTSADWDLFYRVACRYQVGFVNEELTRYRVHGENMHGNISRMERDMLVSYEKAFAGQPGVPREAAYGSLHKVLAGSYFRARQYGPFVRQAMLSLRNQPSNIGYFAQFPLRRLRGR